MEAQGPPPQARSKYNVLTCLRFPGAVLLPSILILFIGICTLALGITIHRTSCSVRPDQSEEITNLITRLDATKVSLDVCTRNSTRLGIDLGVERVRLGVCRENGKRLAERVDKVEGDLELCANQKLVLEDELKAVRSKEEACETENVKLRRQVEDGAFIDFREFVGSLGTGGYALSFTSAPTAYSSIDINTDLHSVTRGCARTPPDHGTTDMSLNGRLTRSSLLRLGKLNSPMLSTLLYHLSSRLQLVKITHQCLRHRSLQRTIQAILK